jgi:hypothetical protein
MPALSAWKQRGNFILLNFLYLARLDIFLWHAFKQMFAYLGTKIICLVFVHNLERRILRINFHCTYVVNLKCQTRRVKSLHIETTHDFPLPPAGAPHDGQNRALLSI